MTEYGYRVEVPQGYDEAVVRTQLALKGEGFSILTAMHVGGLLDESHEPGRRFLIMGAWSPATSNRELGTSLHVAVHLPCNVVVQEQGDCAIVAVLDPADDAGADSSVDAIAQARAAVGRVLQQVSEVA